MTRPTRWTPLSPTTPSLHLRQLAGLTPTEAADHLAQHQQQTLQAREESEGADPAAQHPPPREPRGARPSSEPDAVHPASPAPPVAPTTITSPEQRERHGASPRLARLQQLAAAYGFELELRVRPAPSPRKACP